MVIPRIYYKEPVFRPPSEANSLLIQATEGCTYKCSFCIGNEGKKFLIRPIDKIKQDIDSAKIIYGDTLKKMFLLDGNAFVMNPQMLIDIANYSYKIFPKLHRIGAYSHAKDILAKSDEELKDISEAGIKILYLGIETGDNTILEEVNKRVTSHQIIEACHKLYKAGITLSATIILGITGDDDAKSYQHAVETANLINSIKPNPPVPWYLSALTLMIPPKTPIFEAHRKGSFSPMKNKQIIQELKYLFENLDDTLEKCIFRSNHASNYLPLSSNNLSKDKDKLLCLINSAVDNPSVLRDECFRGL